MNDDFVVDLCNKALDIVLMTVGFKDGRTLLASLTLSPGASFSSLVDVANNSDGDDKDAFDSNDFLEIVTIEKAWIEK